MADKLIVYNGEFHLEFDLATEGEECPEAERLLGAAGRQNEMIEISDDEEEKGEHGEIAEGVECFPLKRNREAELLKKETSKASRYQDMADSESDVAATGVETRQTKEADYENRWGKLSRRVLIALRYAIPEEEPVKMEECWAEIKTLQIR